MDAQEGDEFADELGTTEQDITAAPTNLVATITAPTRVSLTWSGPVGATYQILRSNTPGTETAYTTNSPTTSTTFVDSNLVASTQYCYQVIANVVGAGGVSPRSNEQCVTMSSGPQAPSNVSALATSSSTITVTWTAVASATAYYIYISTGGGPFNSIGTATPPATSFVVGGLQPSTTYSFEVRTGFLGGVVSGYSMPPAVATTFPAGLEGYYRYDDKTGTSAVDLSGYSRTATLSGGAVFSTTQQAPIRNEVDKNPSSLSLPTATSVATSNIATNFSGDATIATWVRIPALPAGAATITIAGRRDASCGTQAWALGQSATSLFFAGATGVNKNFGVSLAVNTWTHVAVSQHAGTIKMYINGVQAATSAYVAGPTSTGAFQVGAAGGCANAAALFVDDLKIFSRTLKPTEVDTLGRAPTAPTNLIAAEIHSNRIKLGYTAPTTGADKYYIYRGTAAGNEVFFTSNTPTTFNSGTLAPSTQTSWKVQAQKNGILSAFSNELVVSTLAPPPAPANVTGSISNCCTPKRVNLSWTAEPRAVVYRVFQTNVTDGGSAVQIAAPTGTTLQTGSLVSGKTYSWYVKSQDDGFTQSAASNSFMIAVP